MVCKEISDENEFHGIRIFETTLIKKFSAITLPGIGIFIHPSVKGLHKKRMLQHEYGHYLDYQSYKSNTIMKLFRFYFAIGIPSLFNTMSGIGGNHKNFRTEIRANQFALEWFGKDLAEDFLKYYPTEKNI